MEQSNDIRVIEEAIGIGGYSAIDRVEIDGTVYVRKRYCDDYGDSGSDEEHNCDEAIKVFQFLKGLGVENLPGEFKKVSPHEIIMSDLSENGEYFVVSWTDVNAGITGLGSRRYEVSDTGVDSFRSMLELFPDDLALMSKNKVLIYLDTLIFSFLIEGDHIEKFKGTFCDFDDVSTPDNYEGDIQEYYPNLMVANVRLVHSALTTIIERVFTKGSQDKLQSVLDEWQETITSE